MNDFQKQIDEIRRELAETKSLIEERDVTIEKLKGELTLNSDSLNGLKNANDTFDSRITTYGLGKTALKIKPEEDIQVGALFMDSAEVYSAGDITELNGLVIVGKENPDTQVRFPSTQLRIAHQPQTTGSTNQSFFDALRAPSFTGDGTNSATSVTSGASTTSPSNVNFTTNELAGALMNIYNSSGTLQFSRQIASNTATEITIDGTWPDTVSGGRYEIYMPVYFGSAGFPWRQGYFGGQDVSSGGTGVQRRLLRFGYGTTAGADVIGVYYGTGSPEGVVTANVGSTYHRTDNATSFYIKTSGTGNTGWSSFTGGGAGTNIQVFTASGTFNVPAGVTNFKVEIVGGGAGGGGTNNSGGSTGEVGQSGGGAGYTMGEIDLTGVSSVTVTIGSGGTGGVSGVSGNGTDGGDSTFGAYLTAEGGNADGSGGAASGGDFNQAGGSAGTSWQPSVIGSSTNVHGMSGEGGASFMGPGAQGAFASSGNSTAGRSAIFYGGGGSGGASGSGGTDIAGGDGKGGVCIITW